MGFFSSNGYTMGKSKKKKGGIFGKAPHCAGVGIPFFVGISLFKMPTNQTANQKEKKMLGKCALKLH